MPMLREVVFDTPFEIVATSCDAVAAAVRDSRHASGRSHFGQDGSCGYAGRGFSRTVREYVWLRTEPRRSRDKCCPRLSHRAREAPTPAAVGVAETVHGMRDPRRGY